MESALAFLSMIDPEAFEIALTAVTPTADQPEDAGAIPLCRRCGAPVAIFPDRGLDWRHFRGNAATSGTQETYDQATPPRSPGSSQTRTRKTSNRPICPAPRRSLSGAGSVNLTALSHFRW
jgi:hypothetical protein